MMVSAFAVIEAVRGAHRFRKRLDAPEDLEGEILGASGGGRIGVAAALPLP